MSLKESKDETVTINNTPDDTKVTKCNDKPHKTDLISRQAAIDEIKALYEWHDTVTEDRTIDHLKRLPPAQPETHGKRTETHACDCISREAAIHLIAGYDGVIDKSVAKRLLIQMPPAQPEYKLDEWCHDCKEYDQEHHCCPRYNRVIREALKDTQSDRIAIAKEKILQCISELEENSKYHADFIQRNTKFIIEGLRMALDFMKESEEHD